MYQFRTKCSNFTLKMISSQIRAECTSLGLNVPVLLPLIQSVQEANFSFDEQQRVGYHHHHHHHVLSQRIQRNNISTFLTKRSPSYFDKRRMLSGACSNALIEAADHIDIHATHPLCVSKVGWQGVSDHHNHNQMFHPPILTNHFPQKIICIFSYFYIRNQLQASLSKKLTTL